MSWNTHNIRLSRTRLGPSGLPDQLYFFPGETNGTECKREFNQEILDDMDNHFDDISQIITGDEDVDDYFEMVMEHIGRNLPSSWQDGISLYLQLLEIAQNGR